VRALLLGYIAKGSRCDVVSGRRLTSVMVASLPASYVENWVATGVCTVFSVLVLHSSALRIMDDYPIIGEIQHKIKVLHLIAITISHVKGHQDKAKLE